MRAHGALGMEDSLEQGTPPMEQQILEPKETHLFGVDLAEENPLG